MERILEGDNPCHATSYIQVSDTLVTAIRRRTWIWMSISHIPSANEMRLRHASVCRECVRDGDGVANDGGPAGPGEAKAPCAELGTLHRARVDHPTAEKADSRGICWCHRYWCCLGHGVYRPAGCLQLRRQLSVWGGDEQRNLLWQQRRPPPPPWESTTVPGASGPVENRP